MLAILKWMTEMKIKTLDTFDASTIHYSFKKYESYPIYLFLFTSLMEG